MLDASLIRIEPGEREIRAYSDLSDDMLRSITPEEARSMLLPLLPPGTTWPEQATEGTWRSGANELHAKVFPADRAVLLRASAFRGPVADALRRIRDTRKWIIVSGSTGELFNFDDPEEN